MTYILIIFLFNIRFITLRNLTVFIKLGTPIIFIFFIIIIIIANFCYILFSTQICFFGFFEMSFSKSLAFVTMEPQDLPFPFFCVFCSFSGSFFSSRHLKHNPLKPYFVAVSVDKSVSYELDDVFLEKLEK